MRRWKEISGCVFLMLVSLAVLKGAEKEKLIVGVTNSPPFSFQQEDDWSGISVELWEEMARSLDLEYELKPVSLDGLVDGLKSGSIDVGAAALVATPEREASMDFTHSFFGSGLSVATTTERQSAIVGFLKRLFTIEAFLALGGLTVLLIGVGIVIWAVERKVNPDQFGGSTAQGLGSGFWWSAVTMTTVGYGDKAPISAAGRMVGLIWMFASIILISGFTGAIASALTVSRLTPKIHGLEDLGRVKVGAVEGSNGADFLRNRGIQARVYPDSVSGLAAVKSGAIDGFVNDAPVLKYYVRREFADSLVVIDQTFDPGFYAFALAHDTNFRESLNIEMLRFMQTASWEEILRRYGAN